MVQAGFGSDFTVRFEASLGIPQGIVKGFRFRRRWSGRRCARHTHLPGETRWAIPPQFCMSEDSIVRALAAAFLGGEFEANAVAARGALALGHEWRWLRPLARRFVQHFAGSTRPKHRDIVQFLLLDDGLESARRRHGARLLVAHWIAGSPMMDPVQAAVGWAVPGIESPAALASWLGVDGGELEWFSDLKGYMRRPRAAVRLRHYHYRILAKDSGSIRLIEAPKSRLKEIQRKLLSEILNPIPAHAAVHGFRKGRSISSFAGPHTGQRVVLKLDLQDFFPSIGRARVQALFRTAGYPEAVADLLGGLCSAVTPREVWGSVRGVDPNRLAEVRTLYAAPHLPQGAPTSPAIANLCAYRLDCRLSGLAKAASAEYTRYADDLAFSGGEDFERGAERFGIHVAAIVLEEGFELHHRKTRIMRQGVRQQLAGLVVNDHVNIRRSDFDELKAILTNCARGGWAGQNRDGHADFRGHLDGRVGFVESVCPERGVKLRAIFDRVDAGAGGLQSAGPAKGL